MPAAALCVAMNTMADTTEVSPAWELTEISRPPSSITTVCTTERMPTIATVVPIVARLLE